MTTVLQYLVIAAIIGGVVFALAVFVFGRGEQLAPLPPRTSPTVLPDRDITGQDVRSIRFAMTVRGYRMSDVDWVLERMATELDELRTQLAEREAIPVATQPDDLAGRRATVAQPSAEGDSGSAGGPSGGDGR